MLGSLGGGSLLHLDLHQELCLAGRFSRVPVAADEQHPFSHPMRCLQDTAVIGFTTVTHSDVAFASGYANRVNRMPKPCSR